MFKQLEKYIIIIHVHVQYFHSGCPTEFILINEQCYSLLTKYSYNDTGDDVSVSDFSVQQAHDMCHNATAEIPSIDSGNDVRIEQLYKYLDMWNHTDTTGSILVAVDNETECRLVQVRVYFVFPRSE